MQIAEIADCHERARIVMPVFGFPDLPRLGEAAFGRIEITAVGEHQAEIDQRAGNRRMPVAECLALCCQDLFQQLPGFHVMPQMKFRKRERPLIAKRIGVIGTQNPPINHQCLSRLVFGLDVT